MSTVQDESVKYVFDSFPPRIKNQLLVLRDLILSTASTIPAVGRIEETLKWGEPAYLTSETKAGTTIRIGWKKSAPNQFAMYFNCQTNLVDTFRAIFPELKYQGNRAIVFELDDAVPRDSLTHCVEMAFTYHQNKRAGTKRQKIAT
jgi:hypothetical protein